MAFSETLQTFRAFLTYNFTKFAQAPVEKEQVKQIILPTEGCSGAVGRGRERLTTVSEK